MLERAKGCLEHNGRRLLRLKSDLGRTQHTRNTFWSHGAGDIEIPAWWSDLLSKSTSQEKEKDIAGLDYAQYHLAAGVHSGRCLEFLYPPKTQTFLSKLAIRGGAQRSASCEKAPAVSVRPRASYRTSVQNRGVVANAAAQHPVCEESSAGHSTAEDFAPDLDEHSVTLDSSFEDFEQSCKSYWLLVNHERDDFVDRDEILEAAEQILQNGREVIWSLWSKLSKVANESSPGDHASATRSSEAFINTQSANENRAAGLDLQELRDSLTKYDDSVRIYDQVQSTANIVDPEMSSDLVRRELLQTAEQTLANGEAALAIAQEFVLEFLHERKGIENWTARDWRAALGIHFSQGSTGSLRFVQTLETMFERGWADVGMPVIINMLVADESMISRGVARLYLCHQLYTGYTAWRETLPDDEQQTTKRFWDYAATAEKGSSIFRLRILYRRLKDQWKNERHLPVSMPDDVFPQTVSTLDSAEPGLYTNAKGHKRQVRNYLSKLAVRVSQAENIIALAEVVISHPDFQRLDSFAALDVFNWLTDVIKEAPASFETMARLFKVFLLVPLRGQKRIFADLNAFKLFEAMEIYGGYAGETIQGAPDLARKLYHNLRKSELYPQMVPVMTHLQGRFVDRLEDYASLREYLASVRDVEGLAALEAAYAQAVERRRDLYGKATDLVEVFGTPPLDIYKNRLELHRRRREPRKMLEIMEEMKADPQCEPDQQCYNKIISAHARSNDLDGADFAFRSLVEAGFEPDVYAYIPIMEALAREGNISAVRDITKEMDLHGIPLNDWVINAHVSALLQRGRLTSAEALVRRSSIFKLVNRTTMWNSVILHWALRGHRGKVNLLMDTMRTAKIPYDVYTYAARMTMWIKRGSPRRAWSILRSTLPRLGLRPLPLHFALMIRAYTNAMGLRQGNIRLVYKHMVKLGVQPDWTVASACSAAYRRARMTNLPRTVINDLEELASDVQMANEVARGQALRTGAYQPQDETFQIGLYTLVYGLSGPDAHEAFDRVWASYVDLSRPGAQANPFPGPASPPMQVLYRIMSTFSSRRAWSDVERCWKSMVEKAEGVAKTKDGEVFPLHRFMLAGPLKQYLNCLYEEGASIKRVKDTVFDVLRRGFALDNRCWNLYVRLLCVSGPANHLLALQTAEEQLIFGLLSYPPVLGKVVIPESKADIIRSKLEKRSTRTGQAFRNKAGPHFPFRMESSIGQNSGAGHSKTADSLWGPFDILDATSWSEIGDTAQQSALDIKTLGKDDAQRAVDRETIADLLTNDAQEDTGLIMGRLDDGKALAKRGLVGVRSFLDEGSLLRRPEYDTLVYLAGVYLQIRRRLTLDTKGAELLREIHQTMPRLMKMIMSLPRVDDKLQKAFLRQR